MLPKRAARSIVVDDVAYRWFVSETPRLLLVERADGVGGRLEVELVRELEGMYWVPLETTRGCGPLMPRIVAEVVRAAQLRGWNPKPESRAFRLRGSR